MYFRAYIIGVRKFLFLLFHYLKSPFVLFFAFLGGRQHCIICNKGTYLLPLCRDCRNERFYKNVNNMLFYQNRCKICGRPLVSTREICPLCRETNVLKNVDKTLPLFEYRLWNKELLFLWKIQGIRTLSVFFANLCRQVLENQNVKFIVPVPPRPGKIQKNGWDQIDELCNFLELRYGFCRLNLLERTSNLQQKKLGRTERFEKSELSYCMKNQMEVEKELSKTGGCFPAEVCIIDDVCTTGATLESCASVLRAHTPIKKITSMTLFIV